MPCDVLKTYGISCTLKKVGGHETAENEQMLWWFWFGFARKAKRKVLIQILLWNTVLVVQNTMPPLVSTSSVIPDMLALAVLQKLKCEMRRLGTVNKTNNACFCMEPNLCTKQIHSKLGLRSNHMWCFKKSKLSKL